MTRDMGDLSMLELFRMEGENHTKVLFSGLPTLVKDSSPELIEPLLRAAQSLRGAARIVSLTDAIDIAESIEKVLELCKSGETAASTEIVDVLLSATKFLADLAAVEVEEMDKWLDDNSALRTEILAKFDGEADVAPESDPEIAGKPEPKNASKPKPALKPKLEPKPTPVSVNVSLADSSMLDLFRMEAESHSQSLTSGLLELEKNQSLLQKHFTARFLIAVRPEGWFKPVARAKECWYRRI